MRAYWVGWLTVGLSLAYSSAWYR